jgi:ankyrin repeat protein
MKLIQLLWEFGAEEHIAKNVHNSDILTKAIEKGNMTMLRFLCEHGASQIINEIDRYGKTPLAAAIERSNIPMIQYVLEHGATGSLQRASQYIAEKLDGTRTIKYLSAINFVQAYTRIKFIKEENAQEIIALLTEWEAKTKQAETVVAKTATE